MICPNKKCGYVFEDDCVGNACPKCKTPMGKRPRHLSYSQVNMYLTCGMRYYFRYIKGLKIPPRAPMSLGSAVDKSCNHNYEEKIESGKDVPESVLTDVFVEDWRARIEETDFEDNKPDQFESDGLELVKVFRKELAPKTKPLQVQPKIEITFPNRDYTYLAYPDLIIGDPDNPILIDHKTSAKMPSKNYADTLPQLTAYAGAYKAVHGILPIVGIHQMIRPQKTNPARALIAMATREDEQVLRWWRTIDRVNRAIEAEVFTPAALTTFGRANFECTPEWCGYYYECKKEL